jgi:hypothetical protein
MAVLMSVSDAITAPHRLAPGLGEHTDQILSWAGDGPEAVAELRSRRVVR